MRNLKSLLMVAVALILVSCSMSAKPEKNETEKASAQGEVIALNKADFLSKVYNYEKNQTQWVYEGNKPAIIDFYADWCGPCKMISPILEELAKEYEGKVTIVKVNVDENGDIAGRYGVMSIPNLVLFKNGDVVKQVVGFQPKNQLQALLNSAI